MSAPTHAEFVAAYRAGALRVRVERHAAAAFLSQRLLLPFVLLPVFGLAVALALAGHLFAGVALFVLALGARALVRASAAGFVLARALASEVFYREALAARVLWLDTGDASLPQRAGVQRG